MSQLVFELSVTLGLGGALFAGATSLLQGHGFWTVALRTMIGGGMFFLFALLGGHLVARSLLERLAQKRMEHKAAAVPEKSEPAPPSPDEFLESIRQAAAQADSDRLSEVSQAQLAEQPQANRQAA
ncbi:MAG: hypothetical protein KC729_19225 [Candidatus Eisenbacteria bacterium]|uniref:Uncharacterized protein n=1 Tax=Eiseniibacteriota bacterium TaxID=2212470 RepID=A0A956RSM2_UNCEI|nr:hypothetical protein [Candidatus Eisenbacteria bacterium]